MSKRRNNNNRNTDTSENEQTESVESQEDQDAVDEIVDDIVEEQDQQDVDEAIDEIVEEIDAQVDDEQEEVEQMSQDKEQDQGFDQESTAVAETSSGGNGMAGTAMAVSLLALAGTGYNLYDAKSSESTQTGSDAQVTVDYSEQIQTLEQQIQSLTESQENLASMTTVAESAVEETQAVVDSATEQASEVEESTAVAEAEEASTQTTETLTQEAQAEQSAAAEESDSQEVSDASDSETVVSETGEQAASEDTATAVTQSQESETEMVTEASTEQAAEIESSTANEQAMVVAAAPNTDEIKQIARQEVDAVLAEAKKRLGLNEVAQLLSIGEQRLALAGDVTGAQTALGIANERLSAFSDPLVDPVRDSVASNIESLSAVEVVDKSALTQDLGSLASAVDTLAFKPLETLADEPAEEVATQETDASSTEQAAQTTESDGLSLEGAGNFIKSWGSKFGDTIGDVGSGIAGDLKDMVRIKKTGPLSDVVLAPEQEYFIRENMKLMLGGAQRAVLQSNVGVYQQNIEQAQSLLGEFFDGDNEDVQSVAGQLSDLAQINLEPELPDISNSSTSLSEVLKQLASADSSAN